MEENKNQDEELNEDNGAQVNSPDSEGEGEKETPPEETPPAEDKKDDWVGKHSLGKEHPDVPPPLPA